MGKEELMSESAVPYLSLSLLGSDLLLIVS